jgi:hypothetical protein
MPDSVMTTALYPEFMKTAGTYKINRTLFGLKLMQGCISGENLDLEATELKLKALINQLPQENLKILKYLIEFLTKVTISIL